VAKACAENLVPCGLELGGKDAAIVLADAPLERAVHGIVWGALMNAGQSCASVERVYVEAPIYDAFLKRLVEVVGEVRMGVEMGPLATERQRETVAHHVQTAKDRGASVLAGGQKLDEGFGYAPTVVSVDHDDLPLMQEETFGPVIPVAKVRDAEEALARANASRFGLTASVWTADEERGRELAFRLRAGVVTVNNHGFTGALAAAPWCGVGETGYGITNSKHALDMLTRPRFVLVDHRRAARELWWFPYTPALRTIALSLATLRSETQGIGAKRRAAWALVGAFLTRFKTS
jgi:acyl-CoA reductase-like NAD-dependent aldehyde dehydrogenase